MSTTKLALLLALPVALVAGASCAENAEPAAPPGDDAGATDAKLPPVDAGISDADPDADTVPEGCVGDWCSVALEGLEDVGLNAIWGSGPDNVWVVGSRGFAARFDGAKWEVRRASTLLALFSVWGTGPNDVWAGNSGEAIFHWDGSSWKESSLGFATDDSRAVLRIAGSGPENVFALVEPDWDFTTSCPGPWGFDNQVACPTIYRLSRVNGELAWRQATSGSYLCDTVYVDQQFCVGLNGLWVDPSGEPWAVGHSGRAVRPRGPAQPPLISGGLDETHAIIPLEGISGVSTNDVWTVGGGGTTRHFVDGAWQIVSSPTTAHLRAVWARSANDAWAVGDEGTILHWNGTTWQPSASPVHGRPRALYGVWGDANGNTWIAGEHVLLHRAHDTSRP